MAIVDREQELYEELERVIDVWNAPTPEEFARVHRVLFGTDSCSEPGCDLD